MKLIDILLRHKDAIAERVEATNYFAMDPDGRVFGYQVMPEPDIMGWSVPGIKNSTDGYGCLVQIDPIDVLEGWQECIVTLKQYESALAASQQDWNGDGLPPVGMDIEYKFPNAKYRNDFSRGKVLAFGVKNVFMEHWSSKNEFIQPLDNIEFRPICSEADKKRDAAIEEMLAIYFTCPPVVDTPNEADRIAMIALYDAIAAGKVPGIRIE